MSFCQASRVTATQYPGSAPGIAGKPGMTQWSGERFGQPNFQSTDIGNLVGNELYNPETGGMERTGAQKGTNAGQALKALAEA